MDSNSNPDLDEGAIAHKVFSERTRVLTARSVKGALTSPLGTLLLAWIESAVAGWGVAIVWLCLINATEFAIIGAGYRYRRSHTQDSAASLWAKIQIGGAGLVGLAWGSSVWFFWVEGQYLMYLLNLTVLVGVSGVCMIIMSPFRSATLLFSAGILLPPLVHLGVVHNPYAMQIGTGLVVLFAVQIQYAREVELELFRELDQSVRNGVLVHLLSLARGNLHQVNLEIQTKNAELQTALEYLNELVTHDQLTGAYSRRFVFDELERQASIRARHGVPVCVVVFDLDHFKVINDCYGHPVGDRALREVVSTVNAQLREGDILARVGGEEFLVLLPTTGREAARLLADRLRVQLANGSITEGSQTIQLPASFGVAELAPGESVSSWLQRADAALYQAKQQGRNRLVTAP